MVESFVAFDEGAINGFIVQSNESDYWNQRQIEEEEEIYFLSIGHSTLEHYNT